MAKKEIKMGEFVHWKPLQYYWFKVCFAMFLVLASAVSNGGITLNIKSLLSISCSMLAAGAYEILRLKGKNETPPDSTTYTQTEIKEDKTGSKTTSTETTVQ